MITQRRLSLLYAEDEPQARELLAKLLRLKLPELELYVAADGAQGIALFHEHRPELILTDIMMPVLDGFEMIKRIRAVDPDAYIIALTAYNDAEWQVRSKELRLNQCISKPVEFKRLLETVGCAIEQLQQRVRPTTL